MSFSLGWKRRGVKRRRSVRRSGGRCGRRATDREDDRAECALYVDKLRESLGTAVDHSVIPWVSVSIVCLSFASSWIIDWSLVTAWRTVVWSLPPKARPMSLSDAWVSWRERYMATWRGKATDLVRFLARMSESLMPKNSATLRWIWSIVITRSSSPQRSVSTSWASSTLMSRPESEQKAIILVSEPSISRILALMRLAIR